MNKKKNYIKSTALPMAMLLSAVAVSPLLGEKAYAAVEATQQQGNIKGTVVDSNGEPVIGANVIIEGTTIGTITDIDGVFMINAKPGQKLTISFIGYNSVTVPAKADMKVTLSDNSTMLGEVQVVAYGVQKKVSVTGAISSVGSEELMRTPVSSVTNVLGGQMTGLTTVQNSGEPGADAADILVRGKATFGDSSPLIQVDGVERSMTDIDPNEIESVTVLKDASATAVFGIRGANGVIMVTTKRGNAGKGVHVSYDGSLSIGKMARKIDVMDANEWMSTFKQGLENANEFQGKNFTTDLSQIFTDERLFNADGSPKYNTNWQDEASRTAISHNHQISIQRTGEGSSIGAFINYTDQQGILLNSYFKRINAKLAYDDKPTDWLSTSVNLLVNHTWGNRTSDNPYGQGALRTMIEQLPFLPVKLDGEYTQTNIINTSSILNNQTDPNSGKQGFSPEGVGNPVELLERMQAMQYRTQIFGNAALPFHLMKGLDLKTQFGIDYHNNRDANYTPFTPRPMINQSSEGAASANNSNSLYWQEETYLTYVKDINKHHINAMAGMSWQEYNYTKFEASDSKYIDDFYGYYNLGSGTNRPSVGSDYDKWAMNSYFLRFAYTYKDRYSATVTGRIDGSSKFGDNNKYAFFPSVAAAWNISSEEFMESQTNYLDMLKIRLSWGSNGNQAINPYQTLDRLTLTNYIWGDNGTVVNGAYLPTNGVGNPNLRWETSRTINAGIDFSFFNGRLSGNIDVYVVNTSDLLMSRTVPYMNGYKSIMDNVGKTRNKGVEIALNSVNFQNNDFSWTTNVNFSLNRDKIIELRGDGKDDITNKWFIGEPLRVFYDYNVVGTWQENETYVENGHTISWDAESGKFLNEEGKEYQKGAVPGSAKLEDKDGNGSITADDKKIIGSKLPSFLLSMGNRFDYKNIYFSFLLNGVFGQTKELHDYNFDRWMPTYNYISGMDYWTPENPTNEMTSPAYVPYDKHSFYKKMNYVNIKNITIGYTFPKTTLSAIGISSLSINASVNNLYTFSNIDNWLNLEDSDANRNVLVTYPTARSYMFGLNLTF